MKTILFIIAALVPSVGYFAQYKPVDQESSLNFTIRNFGIEVGGKFTGLQGEIKFDPANLAESSFDVSIDAASVNTDNSLRDHHLQGESYFDVKAYPRIRFASTKVTGGKNGACNLTGKLTIKKTTRNISFPFTATQTADGYRLKAASK